jgi:hypothetical protein
VLDTYQPFIHGRGTILHQQHGDIVELLGPDRDSTSSEYKPSLRTHKPLLRCSSR